MTEISGLQNTKIIMLMIFLKCVFALVGNFLSDREINNKLPN